MIILFGIVFGYRFLNGCCVMIFVCSGWMLVMSIMVGIIIIWNVKGSLVNFGGGWMMMSG